MSDFKFNREDMFDSDKLMKATVDQVHKDMPDDVINLQTSRHKDGRGNPLNVTMFNLSEILMKIPAFDSVEDVLGRLEATVAGTTGAFYDKLEDFPFIQNLIPDDIRVAMEALNPNGTGKEQPAAETTPSTPSTSEPLPPDSSGESAEVRSIRQYLIDSGVEHKVGATKNHSKYTATGNVSNHCKEGTNGIGLAADITWLKPGKDTREMLNIFTAFYKCKSQLAELIYSHPDAAGMNISQGKHHKYTGVTFNMHHNHVHVGLAKGTFLKWVP